MPRSDSNRTEALLVLRAQLGDRKAAEVLLRRTAGWLGGYLAKLVRDEHLAADVLQDVLLIVWRRLGHLHEPRAYRAWVYRTASREAFRQIRKRTGRRGMTASIEPDALDMTGDPELTHPDPDELERLRTEIEQLSPNTRAVVVLHYCEGLSLRQVAAVLDLPGGTIRSRLAWALARLRARIGTSGQSKPKG